MCVYVFEGVCMYVHGYAHLSVHMQVETLSWCQVLPGLLSTEPGTHPFSSAGCTVSSRIPPTPTSLALGLETHTAAGIWLLMAPRDPNLDFHAWSTGTSPAEILPQPQ